MNWRTFLARIADALVRLLEGEGTLYQSMRILNIYSPFPLSAGEGAGAPSSYGCVSQNTWPLDGEN